MPARARSAAGGNLMSPRRPLRSLVMLLSLGMTVGANAAAHDWYTGLRQPGTGISCCGGYDCRPLQPEQIRHVDGRMQFFLDNEWRDVDPWIILERPSPDGRVHACWNAASQRLICVILPGTL